MSNANIDYQSNVRWFLDRPLSGNSPLNSSRQNLSGLTSATHRLFQDCLATQNAEVIKVGGEMYSAYNSAFMQSKWAEVSIFVEDISKLWKLAANQVDNSKLSLQSSVKHAVAELIDFSMANRDHQLANSALVLAQMIAPSTAPLAAQP